MSKLWTTIAMMIVSTTLIFGVPMLFERDALETRTIAMEVDMLPHEGAPPGGDATTQPMEPAPAPWRGLAEVFLDHAQEFFWAFIQAFLIARYVKKRG